MAGVVMQGDWSRLINTLESLELSQQELTSLNRRLGFMLEQSTRERFEDEQSPEGERWKPLSDSTLISRAARRGRTKTKRGGMTARAQRIVGNAAILKDSGRLMRSITSRARPEGVAVGTNLVYGAIHQKGGKAGRGKRVQIPARPYLGISKSDEQDIMDLLNEFIEERVE